MADTTTESTTTGGGSPTSGSTTSGSTPSSTSSKSSILGGGLMGTTTTATSAKDFKIVDKYAHELKEGARVERKMLITAVEWDNDSSDGTLTKMIVGRRTEDSSIEFNADSTTSTDILGITYTDVNKTEPQQSFDPQYILGKNTLSEYLTKHALKNDISAYNGTFNVYLITYFLDEVDTGTAETLNKDCYCVKHKGCTVIPTAIGGDSWVNMPIEVHLSNDIEEGIATMGTGKDKWDNTFTFTKFTS